MIELRPTTLADLDFVRAVESSPENVPFIQQWTREEHAAAVGDRDVAHQIILQQANGVRVGYTILRGLTSPHRALELKRLVIVTKGKGYGRQALAILQHQAFETYQAHRLQLDVKDFNDRAYHLYQSMGFVEEGRLRECILTARGFETFIVMSLLEPEYATRQAFLSEEK
jgi:RimJ/RimL family protein N-acetyltransferase